MCPKPVRLASTNQLCLLYRHLTGGFALYKLLFTPLYCLWIHFWRLMHKRHIIANCLLANTLWPFAFLPYYICFSIIIHYFNFCSFCFQTSFLTEFPFNSPLMQCRQSSHTSSPSRRSMINR